MQKIINVLVSNRRWTVDIGIETFASVGTNRIHRHCVETKVKIFMFNYLVVFFSHLERGINSDCHLLTELNKD